MTRRVLAGKTTSHPGDPEYTKFETRRQTAAGISLDDLEANKTSFETRRQTQFVMNPAETVFETKRWCSVHADVLHETRREILGADMKVLIDTMR